MLPREASMAKLFVTETAQKAAQGSVDDGGYNYPSEYEIGARPPDAGFEDLQRALGDPAHDYGPPTLGL
jgi:alkylation response protein AidB-like acyl-CoA dehydrogenase